MSSIYLEISQEPNFPFSLFLPPPGGELEWLGRENDSRKSTFSRVLRLLIQWHVVFYSSRTHGHEWKNYADW
jgi:hypothetical protein